MDGYGWLWTAIDDRYGSCEWLTMTMDSYGWLWVVMDSYGWLWMTISSYGGYG